MATKKLKVTVKKKKINKKRVIILFLAIILFILSIIMICEAPIKNIYITGNKLVSDKEIIYLANLENYPSFISTYFKNYKRKIKENKYIKDVNITRNIRGKIYIEIEEYKPLAIYKDKLLLSSNNLEENKYDITYVPTIMNDIDIIYDKFTKKMNLVNNDILQKVSQIEYKPNDIDKERFLLYMIDSNYVYITLSKIEKINKYNTILEKLAGKKGIVYLDSGDYVEIKS